MFKWGDFCDLDCPAECPDGCHVDGNCKVGSDGCPRNCKKVVAGKHLSDCLNSRNECQVCRSGFFGQFCEKRCPPLCEPTLEGICSREGACYACKSGLFGKSCDEKCPKACPKCAIQDGVEDPGMPGVFLQAGSCMEECHSNMWGDRCEKPCPPRCEQRAQKRSSCWRREGKCHSCTGSRTWGEFCDLCPETCAGGVCERQAGNCTKGCIPGYWGGRCSERCPDHTGPQGCRQSDGFPVSCLGDLLPVLLPSGSFCGGCPPECHGRLCNKRGQCMEGCIEGRWGPQCQQHCAFGCKGSCDAVNGHCAACKPGYTGARCEQRCHETCAECQQFQAWSYGATRPGTTSLDCTYCHHEEPATLTTEGTCECIEGASRLRSKDGKMWQVKFRRSAVRFSMHEKVDDAIIGGHCACHEPDDPTKEAHFQNILGKQCSQRCKVNFQGRTLKEVHMIGNHTFSAPLCITGKVQNYVIRSDGNLPQGTCAKDELDVSGAGDAELRCLHRGYVEYILLD